MMTIDRETYLQLLIEAQRCGAYPADGRYYRVAYVCAVARDDGSGDWDRHTGILALPPATWATAQAQADKLQATADAAWHGTPRCVYLVQTIGGIEVYRTEPSPIEDSPSASVH